MYGRPLGKEQVGAIQGKIAVDLVGRDPVSYTHLKIKTADDITNYIGIPTLAIVPALGSQRKFSAKSRGRQGR